MTVRNALSEYEALEQEVLKHYEWSYRDEPERLLKDHVINTLVPLIHHLIHKNIANVNDYPSILFNRKKNPLFCFIVEHKLKFRLNKAENVNVRNINQYLKNK